MNWYLYFISFHIIVIGRASVIAGLSPTISREVLECLHQARSKLILKTGFHLVFLCTPPSSKLFMDSKNFGSLLNKLFAQFPEVLSKFY